MQTVSMIMVGMLAAGSALAEGIPVTGTRFRADLEVPVPHDQLRDGVQSTVVDKTSPAPRQPASSEDSAYLLVSVGAFDFHRDEIIEINLAYRSAKKILRFVTPHYGFLAAHKGNLYVWGGVLVDIYLGNRFVLTPSTAVGLYACGKGGKPLGYPIEFRSGLDIGYRFDDRLRVGIGFYHLSNAGIGRQNPGEESLVLHYDVPLHKAFGR